MDRACTGCVQSRSKSTVAMLSELQSAKLMSFLALHMHVIAAGSRIITYHSLLNSSKIRAGKCFSASSSPEWGVEPVFLLFPP